MAPPPPQAQDSGCCSCCNGSAKLQKMKARNNPNVYVKHWKVSCCSACCEDPCFWCYTCLCPCCVSCGLRKRALHNDVSRYRCCNGECPSCLTCCCCDETCPSCCMCMESFFCFSCSVWTTRYMIMDELRLEADACDACIIGTLIVLETMACICSILGCILGNDLCSDCAMLCHCLAEALWLSACGCMQTQHKIELDERDKHGSAAPPAMMAPAQQMVPMGGQRAQVYPAPMPPQGYDQGYPPQQQYMPQQGGYAPMPGYPPQQQGYYPPQQQQQPYRGS